MTNILAAPVAQEERITILDSLRGIAVLGILIMNMPGFANSVLQFDDLSLGNHFSGPNYWVWWIDRWLLEGSQRAIFSMLFGAGTILFVNRLEKRTEGVLPAEYFIRRQLWLLVFGLFNAYVLLWFWDVLFHYAIFGIVMFVFRRQSARNLLIAAGVCLLLALVRENVDFYREKKVVLEGEKIEAIDTLKTPLTDKQKEKLAAFIEMKDADKLEAKQKRIKKTITQMTGSYADLYRYQSDRSYRSETTLGFYHCWDVLLFMFLGMALFKNGILTGNASTKVYWVLCLAGLGVGLFLSWLRVKPQFDNNFSQWLYTRNVKVEFYQLSRTFRALGIFGLIMLLYKSGLFKWLFSLMRPVGQMAFTNYLMQSFLCALFFYGPGFAMFGKLQPYQTYYVIAAVWTLEIIWSHFWLHYFRFGPLEWLWRSLTYWKKQPIKKTKSLPQTATV